jgi:hypothetical protein
MQTHCEAMTAYRQLCVEGLDRLLPDRQRVGIDQWRDFSFAARVGECCAPAWSRTFPEGAPVRLDLSACDLEGAIFVEAGPVRGASFREAKLSMSRWVFAEAEGCDFSGAVLRGAVFVMCKLSGSSFARADLEEAAFEGFLARDIGTEPAADDFGVTEPLDFTGANLRGARFTLVGETPLRLSGCDLAGCLFRGPEGALEAVRKSLAPEQARDVVFEQISPVRESTASRLGASLVRGFFYTLLFAAFAALNRACS